MSFVLWIDVTHSWSLGRFDLIHGSIGLHGRSKTNVNGRISEILAENKLQLFPVLPIFQVPFRSVTLETM